MSVLNRNYKHVHFSHSLHEEGVSLLYRFVCTPIPCISSLRLLSSWEDMLTFISRAGCSRTCTWLSAPASDFRYLLPSDWEDRQKIHCIPSCFDSPASRSKRYHRKAILVPGSELSLFPLRLSVINFKYRGHQSRQAWSSVVSLSSCIEHCVGLAETSLISISSARIKSDLYSGELHKCTQWD